MLNPCKFSKKSNRQNSENRNRVVSWSCSNQPGRADLLGRRAQIYRRGIYESYTLPLPPLPLAAADRPPLPTNGGRPGKPRGIVGAGPGGAAPALGGGIGAALALAPAAGARMALALAPPGPHVPGGVQAPQPPAP